MANRLVTLRHYLIKMVATHSPKLNANIWSTRFLNTDLPLPPSANIALD